MPYGHSDMIRSKYQYSARIDCCTYPYIALPGRSDMMALPSVRYKSITILSMFSSSASLSTS